MHFFINLLISIIWLTMLVVAAMDCLRSNNEHKLGWMAVIILVPFIGPLLFFRFAHGRYIGEL